jgi:PKD repeat protein
VTVQATDSNGYMATSNALTVVVSPPLVTTLALTTASPVSGENLTFRATVDGGTAPVTYAWLFGDGSKATTGPSVGHVYGSPGTYKVTLWVNDSGGGSAMKTLSVTVAAAPLSIAGLPALEFGALLGILLVVVVVASVVIVRPRRAFREKPTQEREDPLLSP